MEERFWSKVEKSPTCWNWTGAKSNTGYGHINAGGSYLGAHRVAYELIKGPIPAGKQIDHLCRNRACVNPEHMEPVSAKENILRGEGPSAREARQTRCKRGHPLSGENLYIRPDGKGRGCRACRRECNARRYLPDA